MTPEISSGIIVFQISICGPTDSTGLSHHTNKSAVHPDTPVNLNPTILIPTAFVPLTYAFAVIGLKPYEVSYRTRRRHTDDIAAPIMTILMLGGIYAAFIWGLRQQDLWYTPAVTTAFIWIAPFLVPVAYIRRWMKIRKWPTRPLPSEFQMPPRPFKDVVIDGDFNSPPGGSPHTQHRPHRSHRAA